MPSLIKNLDIEKFATGNLFELLGLLNVSQDKKDVLIQSIFEIVENRVFARILLILGEAKRQEFDELIESENEDDLQTYLADQGIDLTQLSAEEFLIYKAEMLEAVGIGLPTLNSLSV